MPALFAVKVVGFLIGACVALALLQAAAATLIIILIVGGIVALIVRPRETIGMVVIVGVTGLARDQPLALISIIGLLLTGLLVAKTIDRLT